MDRVTIMMEQVYILGGLRSYIGVENGIYKHVSAEQLGAVVLRKLIEKYQIKAEQIDSIIGGNAVGGGGNLTRLMALEAGVPVSVPAMTVDVQCGSALESITIGAAMIESGQADLVIAGGFESSSTAPLRTRSKNHPDYELEGDNSYRVAKFVPYSHSPQVMLEGAERTGLQYGLEKVKLDTWALQSHQLAAKTMEQGILKPWIVSVTGQPKERDEGIKPKMSEKLLQRLPCVLPGGKLLTAGNTCRLNDGAAFLILASRQFCQRSASLKPIGKVLASACTGGNPDYSPETAVSAVERLLMRTDRKMEEIDALECNEAFAVIDELVIRKYPGIRERYNLFGGALAYGHPYGASGAIISLHLLQALQTHNGRYGIAAVAASGGVGTAVLYERI